jgi:HAMP domain-containing protein
MSDRTLVPDISKRINLRHDYEARYWSEKFNVSRDELESAVNKVGGMPDDVERELSHAMPHP